MIENLLSEFKLQIVCKDKNIFLTREYSPVDGYSDDEIITEMLKDAHDDLCNENIYTIIMWKLS